MEIELNGKGIKKLGKDIERQFNAALNAFNKSSKQSASALQRHMKKHGFDISLSEARKWLK